MVKQRPIKANKVELKKWTGNKKRYTVQKNRVHSGGEWDMATISFEREIKLDRATALKFLHESNRTDKIVLIENIDIEKELEEGKLKLKEFFKQ